MNKKFIFVIWNYQIWGKGEIGEAVGKVGLNKFYVYQILYLCRLYGIHIITYILTLTGLMFTGN